MESFYREASLALELVIKAAIALRIQSGGSKRQLTKVPMSHNLPDLWRDAELPDLSREDQHRLLIAKGTLLWSGRYAAPKTDDQYERESAELQKFGDTEQLGTLRFTRPRSFHWEDVDRIYRIAGDEIERLASWKHVP